MFYEFLINQFPFGYAFNFDNFLYNKTRHIATQGLDTRIDYFLINKVKKRVEAKIHFLVNDDTAYSPYKSLFGSFEFNQRFPKVIMQEFAEFIKNDLLTKGMREIVITHHASCYHERKAAVVHDILTALEFEVRLAATNHHINIDGLPLSEKMQANERRRLKKCYGSGMRFSIEDESNAKEIHDYIAERRKDKDLTISIGWEKMAMYLEEFPQTYLLFSVRDVHGKICAATVAVRVSKKILYNFLPASSTSQSEYSPMVMLLDGLYLYSQERGYEILDLGISNDSIGQKQQSLIHFKENMGGISGYKEFYRFVSKDK